MAKLCKNVERLRNMMSCDMHNNDNERKEDLKEKLKSRIISNLHMNDKEKENPPEPVDLSMENDVKGNNDSSLPQESGATDNSYGDNMAMDVMHGRKLIGIRYLFPRFPENLSLLQRTRVWVARHDYGYFVGWSEEELQQVDRILRPINEITLELYKKHMNRSEYCRNVKLKFCLESDSPWAQSFRDKLAKDYQLGGFKGLCEVKQAAAELWRNHSERYRGNQARYPNPKSRYKRIAIQPDISVKRRHSQDTFVFSKQPRFTASPDLEFQDVTGIRSTVSSPGLSNLESSVGDQKHKRPSSAGTSGQLDRKSGIVSENNQSLKDLSDTKYSENLETYANILNQTIEKLCTENVGDCNNKIEHVSSHSPLSSDSGIEGPVTEAAEIVEPIIFPALPDTMSVQEKLEIWLERHKRSYFVNVSYSDLELLPYLLRPRKCLTSNNLDEEVSPHFRDAMDNYARLKSSNDELSLRYIQSLSNKSGGFSSVVQALLGGLSVQTKPLCEKEQNEHYSGEFNDALAETWAREARKQLYLDEGSILYSSRHNYREPPHSPGPPTSNRYNHREPPPSPAPPAPNRYNHREPPHSPAPPAPNRYNHRGLPHSPAPPAPNKYNHREPPHSPAPSGPNKYNHRGTEPPPSLTVPNRYVDRTDDFPQYSPFSQNFAVVKPTSVSPQVHSNNATHTLNSKDAWNTYKFGNDYQASSLLDWQRHKSKQTDDDMQRRYYKQQRDGCSRNHSMQKVCMAQNLWSYRSHLQYLCKDDTRLSWRQKLEPFMSVLKTVGGETYEIPDSANECIIDMVLGVLHSAIMDH